MSDTVDLRSALQSWPYDPEDDSRLVRGEDGRSILQVRTPLGIEQYELEGRPDGLRPHGLESALEHHLQKLEQARAAGGDLKFELGPRECSELFNEGTLYYFRYVRLFQLKDWVRTRCDTSRNLRVFDLVNRYARRDEDKLFLEKWRPYILRVHATAGIMIELEKKGYEEALKQAEAALQQLEDLAELGDETFQFERERSRTALSELAEQIRKNRPLSELEQLEDKLRRAVERQEFERAAQLRDQIRALKHQQPLP
jgi:hypothetical protein